ncbi:MAG: hypothetical protein EAZ77_17110 [Nostocales cyanobacterium]|nr:MAG: hypothetical protein EAZ77_17110 [Nostocales cyanobacterium]
MLEIANSEFSSAGLRCGKPAVIKLNSVGYPQSFAEFFIKLLTDEGDLILAPFVFSQRTGFVDVTQ